LIEALDAVIDGDLPLCEGEGVAYQVDRSHRVQYGPDYFAKVAAYEGGEIARRVIDGRLALAARHARPGARLLDYGCGSGEFLRAALAAGFDARGFDVMAETRYWLASRALWADNPAAFEIVTAWDVIEHLENPAELLARIVPGAILLASVPVFPDLRRIRASRHYRPGEHLYYFTPGGFSAWMRARGFVLLEESAHEVVAGRDSIGAFAFRRGA